MRWSAGSKEVSIIIGGNGDGQRPNQFDHIGGLAFDRQGNIYVADWGNNRIQRFDVDFN
jgi:sugar lactone lactonase YvrE